MKKINILLGALAAFGLVSCFTLDKLPEGVLSSANPFLSTGEMQNYINQFYESGLRTQDWTTGLGGYIADGDALGDNLASSAPNTRLNGAMTLSNASALGSYTQIRNVNFFLNNVENCSEKGSVEYNQLVGEGYYFRAWYYYRMLVNYGPITWVDTPLDPSLEATQLPRDSRLYVVDKILEDLDMAASLMRKQNNSASMRIHKDIAYALKSEVALFEATWEKYHKAKNDAFYDKSVTDEKIKGYLQQAIDAAKAVTGWSIATGEDAYRKMFQTEVLSSNPEVMWYKRYDGANIGNNVNRYLNHGGGGGGVTASLVDDYLTIDGKPFVGAARLEAKKTFGKELEPSVRDPRLAQTVCRPGQQLRPDEPEGLQFPPLNGSSYNQNTTGYSLLKYVQIDYTGNLDAEYKGATPAIQFRYADVLLNLAEAYAELDDLNGSRANDANIIAAVQPLRDRVGMPAMDFDREYNTESDYPFKDLPKTIQAVRRERRVEKACEGRRFEDIIRWAAADVLIKGQRPHGALFTGSNLETENEKDGFYDGALVIGQNLFLDENGYVLPINPSMLGAAGYGFKLDRDYLLPIQQRMITLTNGLWEQNPGW